MSIYNMLPFLLTIGLIFRCTGGRNVPKSRLGFPCGRARIGRKKGGNSKTENSLKSNDGDVSCVLCTIGIRI